MRDIPAYYYLAERDTGALIVGPMATEEDAVVALDRARQHPDTRDRRLHTLRTKRYAVLSPEINEALQIAVVPCRDSH